MSTWRFDLQDAEQRRDEAAREAKRLEDAGRGFEANAAWVRYERISGAIEAQARVERVRRELLAR